MVGVATSVDALETELVACERMIGRIRARQLELLRELDAAQVTQIDGSRTLTDWVAARLDVDRDDAKRLTTAAKALADHPDVEESLAAGALSFPRATATARLAASGADHDLIAASHGYDLAGVRRLVARHRRLSRRSEHEIFRDRYFTIQPTLDQSRVKAWFELPGFEGTIVDKALSQRADEFPGTGDRQRASRSTRMADALVSVAQDSLDDASKVSSSGDPLVTVFVDAALAAPTAGEAGAEIAAGPTIGPATLERILCGGKVQVIVSDDTGPLHATAATRSIPPAIRRYVLHRDGGCVIDGCSSRYRLQPHHVVPFAAGGTHDPTNLATLCWYHHHVAIHGEGYTVDPDSPPHRRRLHPPCRSP